MSGSSHAAIVWMDCLSVYLDSHSHWLSSLNRSLPFLFCRIIFIFHKNGQLSSKAKVKPPRLDGQRVGVYSTRSPHRPNALGLTLAKLDKIKGENVGEFFFSNVFTCW